MKQEYQPHLYMICYPNTSLVLSQLTPDKFARKYSYGSATYYSGKLIFAELDVDYRNDYFRIDQALGRLEPHSDGSPKATRYISSYRVLEHVEIDAIKTLYLVNADGSFYALEEGQYQVNPAESDLKVFAEITPLSMLTLTTMNMHEFGEWFTRGENQLVVPRLLYLQVHLDIDDFLEEFERNPFTQAPLEGVHPSKVRDAILEMRRRKNKKMKALTLDTAFTKESYCKITPGFMVMDKKQEKFFPMPSLEEIKKNNYRFYKSM